MKAFPNGMITDDRGVIVSSQPGMDLRDYFAAVALQMLNSDLNAEWNAARAYEMADAMMEARNGSL